MNGEMDFMILNNKVKGVQGTVDNIDTKIDSVATKENIQEVKTLIENSGGGDALESTSQEILSKVADGVSIKQEKAMSIKRAGGGYSMGSGTVASVTGRGVAYVVNNDGAATLTIDGHTVFSKAIFSNAAVPFYFNESLVYTLNTCQNGCYIHIVFFE